jgi:signal transduction histidine kinase
MIYEQHLSAAERSAWPLDASIPWERIDREAAASEPDILAALHDAALVEGYLPVFVPRLMRLLWDDVDATAVLSVELFEGLKHYTALKRYLERVGYPRVAELEERLVEARRGAVDLPYQRSDILDHLTHFMCSELLAARFFLSLSRRTREPVLRKLLSTMARDEFRHTAAAGDLLRKRVEADPSAVGRILDAAERFRHYGNDVVDVPVAEQNDFEAILAVNRKVRQVCGIAPIEHIKETMSHEAV